MSSNSDSELEQLFDDLIQLPPLEREQQLAEIDKLDSDLGRELRGLLQHDDPELEDGRGVVIRDPGTVADPPQERVGPYVIERQLGVGGMGTVYLARQTEPVHRTVALKTIRADLLSDQLMRRFELERDNMARMDHPGIPSVFDAGRTDSGQLYLAMEYVEGVPITEWCDREGLSLPERLRLFVRVCHAVQHAHEKSVIHRDIKPSNILVSNVDGVPTPKLIDFGIARSSDLDVTSMTAQGQLVGTPEYMSPEQVRFDPTAVDTRSDVYSLGLVLYELLVGDLPFDRMEIRRGGPADLQRIVVDSVTPKPSYRVSQETNGTRGSLSAWRNALRGDLDNVVQKALEKEVERRYGSPAALADDLERYLRVEPVVATPPSRGYLARKFARRHRASVIGVSALLVSLILGLVGTTAGYFKAREQETLAKEQTKIAKEQTKIANEQRRIASREAAEAINSLRESGRVAKFLEELIGSAPVSADGKETTLREAVDAAASRIEDDLQDKPRSAAVVHHAIGRAYLALRRFDESRHHLKRAVELNRPWIDANLERLTMHRVSCQVMSEIDRRALKLDDALSWATDGLAPPPVDDIQDRAIRQSLNLGVARIAMAHDRIDEAEAAIRAVMADPVDTPETARELLGVQSDLALILGRRGKLVESEQLLRLTLEQRMQLLGPHHASCVRSFLNHAAMLRRLERYDEAEVQYRRSEEAARNQWGEFSPELASALNGLAHLKRHRNQRLAARDLYRQSLNVLEKVHGEATPAASGQRHSLGSLLTELGELSAAEVVLEINLEILNAEGGRPVQRERTLRSLAELRLDQDRLGEARTLISEALLFSTKLGPRHIPSVGRGHAMLAEIARRMGHRDEARTHLHDVARVYDCAEAESNPLADCIPMTSWRCCAARLARDEGDLELATRIAEFAWREVSTGETRLNVQVTALKCRVEIASADGPHGLDAELEGLMARIRRDAGESDPWLAELGALLSTAKR